MLDFILRKREASERIKKDFACQHSAQTLTRFTCSNGAIQYVMQCDTCKHRIGSPIAHNKLSKQQKTSAQDFDSSALDDRRAEIDHSYKMAREKFNSGAWWKAYTAYLDSGEWKSKRARILIRDNYKCTAHRSGCTKHATEVHHLTYKNVGNEPLDDLTSLCHNCHEQITKESRREWRTL